MKKYGWKAIALVVLAALIFLWLIKAPMMASYLTNRMKVPVSISSISMWPKSTTLQAFRIRNPRGFKGKTAFEAEQILLEYQWRELLDTPSEIDQILMEDIFLDIEFSNPLGTENNWTKIGSQMPKEGNGKEVIIHKLVLTNMTVEIRGFGLTGKPQTRHIERLEFDEISSKKGFPTKELVSEIFRGAGLQQFIQDAFNPEKLFEDLLSPLRGFSGQNEGVNASPPL